MPQFDEVIVEPIQEVGVHVTAVMVELIPTQVGQLSMSLRHAHEIPSSLALIRQPIGKRLVVRLDDFVASFACDWEERSENTRKVAEVLILPVEQALEDFDGQRLASS